MGQCSHGRDVSFGSECWECEAEKRRHKEVLGLQEQALAEQQRATADQQRHQEELLEAQQRQEELLWQAAQAQEMAAQSQRERLNLQKQQIGEERARQQAEEERLELRTGLPEFSDAYRQSWLHLSEESEAIGSKMAALRSELTQVAAVKTKLSQSVQETWSLIHVDLAKELETQLEQGTPRLQDPPLALRDADKQELSTLSASLRTLGKSIGATKAKTLPSDGPLVQLYRELSVLTEKFRAVAQSPPSAPIKAIGCFAFLILCVFVGANSALKTPVIFYLVMASIPAFLIMRRLFLFNRLDETYEPTHQCLSSIALLLPKIADVKLDRLTDAVVAQARETRLKSTAKNAGITLRNLVLTLADLYKRENFSSHALAQRLGTLNSDVEQKARRVNEVTKALEYSAQDTRTLAHFGAMRKEIRRIGRLILDGRRLPGGRIELTMCPTCEGPMSSEEKNCLYCEMDLSQGNHA